MNNYVVVDTDLYQANDTVQIADNITDIYVKGDVDVLLAFRCKSKNRNIKVKYESKEPLYYKYRCATCKQLVNFRTEYGPTNTYKSSHHRDIKYKGDDSPCQLVNRIFVCTGCDFAKCHFCQDTLGEFIRIENDTYKCEKCISNITV